MSLFARRAGLCLALVALLATGVYVGFTLSGFMTSRAVQSPTISLDMVPSGNTYDEATNTMTMGSIDNCLTSATANPNTHLHTVHLVIQEVEDLIGWQARMNYLGDQMRPHTVNFTPFTDNSTGQSIAFLNLPKDQSTSVHRDLVAATAIPAAAAGPQTSLIGAVYNGQQNHGISPDTPAKTSPDDSSYSTDGGGVLASLALQVVGDESGTPSVFMNLDDSSPNAPGSSVSLFDGVGVIDVLLSPNDLGDGYHGEGVTCVPLECTTQECPDVPTPEASTQSDTPTPTPASEAVGSESPTPTPYFETSQPTDPNAPNGALLTANRDRLAICVRAIKLGEGVEDAVEAETKSAVEKALAEVAKDPRWAQPESKLADNPPLVETDCSAPSSVYEPVDPAFPPDSLLTHSRLVDEASYHMFRVFVISEAEIDRLTDGLPRERSIRVVPEEKILIGGDVLEAVTYGIYVSPSELTDTSFLVNWLEKGLGWRDIYRSQ